MARRLIIIRGNSGSGKSTVALQLRNAMSDRTMLLPQDVLRREILKVHDKVGNPVIGLIERMALYGRDNGYDVIIEGILTESKYGEMLRGLLLEFDTACVYYFDIPFEETLKRHTLKPNAQEFGEKEMREWWKEKDYLGVPDERVLHKDMSVEEIIRQIIRDIGIETSVCAGGTSDVNL